MDLMRGRLASPTIVYETWGTLNESRDNAVLIFTGLSPSAHVASSLEDPSAGWWEDMVGPDKPINTRRYFIICVNSLGSCFGSTGPASINPETGKHYRLDFPILCVEDIADTGALVMDHLGIDRALARGAQARRFVQDMRVHQRPPDVAGPYRNGRRG